MHTANFLRILIIKPGLKSAAQKECLVAINTLIFIVLAGYIKKINLYMIDYSSDFKISTDIIEPEKIGVAHFKRGEYNNLTAESLIGWYENMKLLEANDDIIGLILNSQNDEFFANGLDPLYLYNKNTKEKVEVFKVLFELFKKMLSFIKPMAVEINGHVNAAGAMVAIAGDYRIMSNNGRFSFSEVRVGMFLPPTLHKIILKLILPTYYYDTIIYGKAFKPHKAKEIGLVNEVVEKKADLRKRSLAWFKSLKPISNESFGFAKRSFNQELIDFISDNTNKDIQSFENIITTGQLDRNLERLIKRMGLQDDIIERPKESDVSLRKFFP